VKEKEKEKRVEKAGGWESDHCNALPTSSERGVEDISQCCILDTSLHRMNQQKGWGEIGVSTSGEELAVAVAVARLLLAGGCIDEDGGVGWIVGLAQRVFVVDGALSCANLFLSLVAGFCGEEAFALGHAAAFGDLACPFSLNGACILEKKCFSNREGDLLRGGLGFEHVVLEMLGCIAVSVGV